MDSKLQLLHKHKTEAFTEEETKTLFEAFVTGSSEWIGREELRDLLTVLMVCFDLPPFAPDECLDRVIQELQIDAERPDKVSWQDFKSYFVYLVQKPLAQLHKVSMEALSEKGIQGFDNAVFVSGIPFEVSTESFTEQFQNITGHGSISCAFLAPSKNTTNTAVVFLNDKPSRQSAIEASPSTLFEHQIHIEPYLQQRFPEIARAPNGAVKAIASILASTAKFGKSAGSTIDNKFHMSKALQNFDEQHQISWTAARIGRDTSEAISDFDRRLKISQTLKGLGSHADEKLGLSQKWEGFMSNANVQSSLNVWGSFVSSVSDSISQIRLETSNILNEGKDEEDLDSSEIASAVYGDKSSTAAFQYPLEPEFAPEDQKVPSEAEDVKELE